MTLAQMAVILLTKQEQDGIPLNTTFRGNLKFCDEHGYGQLAREVLAEWNALPSKEPYQER